MRSEDYNSRSFHLQDEVHLIPAWSYALAVALFAFAQYFVHVLMQHHRPSSAPTGMRIFWSISWGVALAAYALVVGYISQDAKRRDMNPGLWCLAAIFMPGAIGTLVYFLMRLPLVSPCPHCGAGIEAGANYCGQCRFQIGLACGQCSRSVRPTEVYCGRCGHHLTEDAVPQRLRALQE